MSATVNPMISGEHFPVISFSEKEVISTHLHIFRQESEYCEFEYSHVATPSQKSIIYSNLSPWASITIDLSQHAFSLDRLALVWQAFASHNPCLRTYLWTQPHDGVVFHRVLRHTRPPLSHKEFQDTNFGDLKTAFLVYYKDVERHIQAVTIYIPRALVDSTSLGLLKLDFTLVSNGYVMRDHALFRSYVEYLQTKDTEASRQFWLRMFTGIDAPQLLFLKEIESPSGETRRQVVRQAEKKWKFRLESFEKKSGFDRKLFFEAVWSIVLKRHADSERVVYMSYSRDNGFSGKDTCIGRLDHIYPVIVDLNESDAFREILLRLKTFHSEASQHGNIGLDNLMDEVDLCRIQTSLKYTSSLDFPYVDEIAIDLPLMLFISGWDKFKFTLCFNGTVDSDAAGVLLDHFFELAKNLLDKLEPGESRLYDLPMGSTSEMTKSLELGSSQSKPIVGNLVDMFEYEVACHPTRTALEFEDGSTVSFASLNSYANKIARVAGISKGSIVPICMERSLNLIASIWAVLKSGAAYVTLDPDGAPERNAQIVNEVEAEIVLVNQTNSHRFPNTVIIEESLGQIDESESHGANLDVYINPSDAAYIVYTSGSTGNAKGVILSHMAAVNGISNYSLGGMTRYLLFYNPIFSAAQRAILATLIHGGCLCLVRKDRLVTSLADVLNIMKVESVGLTPSSLSLLRPEQVPHLRQITVTGEIIKAEILSTWATHVDLRNAYGLSECTQLNFGTSLAPSSNPRVVGQPRDTTTVYIVSLGATSPMPFGVPGEICLAGPQLGSGYLKRPEQTSSVFVSNPFGEGKMYRTGDIGLQYPNGEIEILGRRDFQIKINGQRVEPNEVAAVLGNNSQVSAVVVVGVEIDGTKSLVAVIVPTGDADWSLLQQELRKHLQAYLPTYMHPSYLLPYQEIPLNQNGKTDLKRIQSKAQELGRAGLLALAQGDRQVASENSMTSTELLLQEVWAAILVVPRETIQKQDSFMELGGTSMEAIRVVTELRKQGLSLELGDIFRAQSLAEVAKRICVASNTQQELEPFALLDQPLQMILAKDSGIDDAYPVTALQESLIASTLTGNPNYVYQRTYDVGVLDLQRLKEAFMAVFRNRDIYHTTFQANKSTFVQIVRNDMELPWLESDQSVEQYSLEDIKQGIDLNRPFIRVAILQQRYLVVTMHHALFDFWSHQFLYRDVAAVYRSEILPERLPFKNFIQWLNNSNRGEQQSFWSEYLANPERTILNHASTDKKSTATKIVDIDLKADCVKLGLTAGAAIYTSWAILLAHHTGNTDVCFATTISGREAPVDGITQMDGPALASVPQRIFVDPSSSLLSVASRTRDNLWPVIKHSQFGMRNALAVSGQTSSLFDTLVNILVEDANSEEGATKMFKRHGEKPTWQSEYTTLQVQERENSLVISLTSDMEASRIEFILEQFIVILHHILENPLNSFKSIDLVGPSERALLGNLARYLTPEPMMLHSRFEKIAEKSPELLALEWIGGPSWTYRYLNERGNQLAHHLMKSGITRGDFIPLYLDKGFDAIVAILAVMKAGAAYIPLSPSNPIERNTYIILEAEARFIISETKYKACWEDLKLTTILVDALQLNSCPKTLPLNPSTAKDPAYVIYTSGSTGQPKGVRVPHGASAAAVGSMLEAEGRQGSPWRTLQFANYTFDASVQDIFNTLSSGGTLCLAPTDQLLSNLAEVVNRMDIRQIILTPTVARMINPKDVPMLETLILGGEAMTQDVIQAWTPHCRLLNVYGPTETCMVVTTKVVDATSTTRNIGRPFPTVSAMILELESTRYVPYGAIGELCVAGPQITDGYLKREDITKISFVVGDDGQLIYRTGDLARWLPGGEIECLGRKDNQVKIAGHRIELGEIEQAMLQSNVIQNCTALVITANAKPTLAAFCIYEPGQISLVDDVEPFRERLLQLKASFSTLAPYMIPKYIFPMGGFPALPSRKIDRKRLLSIAQGIEPTTLLKYSMDNISSEQVEVVPTTTEEEQALEDMWAELFDIEKSRIGAKASFFALGGDSISAISLASLCRSRHYVLSVGEILRTAVLEDMACCMRRKDNGTATLGQGQYTPPSAVIDMIENAGIPKEQIEAIYPCTPGQIEFLDQGKREEQFWVCMTTRKIPAAMDTQKWIDCVAELTRINSILRSTYVNLDGHGWLSIVLKDATVDVTIQQCRADEKDAFIEHELWQRRFAFGEPFIRYLILDLDDGTREVAIKMDHALYDGTLLRIFDNHFLAIQQGLPIPAHVQFSDFAAYHWRADKSASLEYWKERLDGYSFQYPATKDPSITSVVTHSVDTKIDALANACGVTTPIIFQVAFQTWLAKASGLHNVGFDYLLTGRNVDMESPQLINGNCAQFLPFRSQVNPEDTLQGYLTATQTEFWQATEHGSQTLDDIFAAANRDRKEHGNRSLFLFQPFEPRNNIPEDIMQWVVMRGSKVRMCQPYGLVMEIAKTVNGHVVKVMFDGGIMTKDQAEGIGYEMESIVRRFVSAGSTGKISSFLV